MATPALAESIRIERGSSGDLDSVMAVMDSAFGEHFGEAWTRSQLSGILPMDGVSLMLAWDRDSDTILKCAVDVSRLRLVAGKHRFAHFVGQYLGVAWQQVASNPSP